MIFNDCCEHMPKLELAYLCLDFTFMNTNLFYVLPLEDLTRMTNIVGVTTREPVDDKLEACTHR